MAKTDKDSLGSFGFQFQLKLLASIIDDKKFANRIIEILDPNFFYDETLRVIASVIKDAYDKNEVNLDMPSLEARLMEDSGTTNKQEYFSQYIGKLKEVDFVDIEWTQNKALQFCKQKALIKAAKEILTISQEGELDDFPKCEEIVKKALEHGGEKDESIGLGDNIDKVLSPNFRDPIPTGIKGLDAAMDGGLAKGELGLILAAYGIGKTTILTKLASSAKNNGKNVLQIFFEDIPAVIQQKHYSCWTGLKLSELSSNSEEVKRVVSEKTSQPGEIRLVKLSSDGITIPKIKQYIRKLNSQGFKTDMVCLDYIDCVQASKKIDDQNVAEGSVMREFESMLSDLNIAGWTATQGNRDAIDAAIVGGKQMGGSIKKGQICHFLMTIAKDQDQQDNGTATIAIIKSRFSKSGRLFENAIFDNERIQIELDENAKSRSVSEHKKVLTKKDTERVSFLFDSAKENRLNVLNETPNVETNNNENNG